MPPLPQCANLAAMKRYIAATHSPRAYVRRLHADLQALGSARAPAHHALLTQASAFLDAGTDDLAAFQRIVDGCFKDSALTMCEGFHGIRWQGYEGRDRAEHLLGPETFGKGTPCDLRRSNTPEWCVEWQVPQEDADDDSWGHEAFGREYLDTFLDGIQPELFNDTAGAEWYRVLSLPQLVRCVTDDRNPLLLHVHHTYGTFEPLDGIIAFVCGERLVGSGIGIFQAHNRQTTAATLAIHDLWHIGRTLMLLDHQQIIIRRMQLYAALCTLPLADMPIEVIECLLYYSEGASEDPTPISIPGLIDMSALTIFSKEQLRDYLKCMEQTFVQPPTHNALWTLPEAVIAEKQSQIRQVRERLLPSFPLVELPDPAHTFSLSTGYY